MWIGDATMEQNRAGEVVDNPEQEWLVDAEYRPPRRLVWRIERQGRLFVWLRPILNYVQRGSVENSGRGWDGGRQICRRVTNVRCKRF